jgi:hypothetical protein
MGVASSVIKQQWAAADVYPSASSSLLPITPHQAEQLRLFVPDRQQPGPRQMRTWVGFTFFTGSG